MDNQQVTATHTDGRQYVWTDDSEQSLEDWKAKPIFDGFTFSALVDNPEIAIQAAAQLAHDNLLDAITDPEVKAYLQAYNTRNV